MSILITPEDEQLHKFRIELGKYTNTQEVISTAFKVIEENWHRPADINQKIILEEECLYCRSFSDRSMAQEYNYTQEYIYTDLLEK